MVLVDNEAKEFFHKAVLELGENINDTVFLIKKTGGFWYDVIAKCYVAFDNNSNDLFVEEFDNIVDAKKYANKIMAKTKSGNYI